MDKHLQSFEQNMVEIRNARNRILKMNAGGIEHMNEHLNK